MSTNYRIDSIDNGVAKVVYDDGSWAELVLEADMTEADIDDFAYQYRPKTGNAPTFLAAGAQRTAAQKPAEEPEADDRPQYFIDRLEAYGDVYSQLEYITENGLAAWQAHVAQIKADNPKPADD